VQTILPPFSTPKWLTPVTPEVNPSVPKIAHNGKILTTINVINVKLMKVGVSTLEFIKECQEKVFELALHLKTPRNYSTFQMRI